MKVLVVGGGGREHAIAWKLAQDPEVTKVYAAPGNPGMKGIECISISGHQELADFAKENDIELTMVGPEVPLCDGIVDVFRAEATNLIVSPSRKAKIEASSPTRHSSITTRAPASPKAPSKQSLTAATA